MQMAENVIKCQLNVPRIIWKDRHRLKRHRVKIGVVLEHMIDRSDL